LACTFTFNNSGGGDGSVSFTLRTNSTTGTVLGTSANISVAANGTGYAGTISFTMPAADTTLYVVWNQGTTVYASRLIQVLMQVATTLTIVISPSSVPVGGAFTVSGKLSRADSGTTGISGSIVYLQDASGNALGNAACDASGNYAFSLNAPTTAGSYTYKVYYGGSGLLAASYAQAGFVVGAAGDLTGLIVIGGLVALLLLFGKKK
jgi:hypothetical protein